METKEGQVWCKIGVRWLVLHFAGLSSYIKACPQHCRECDKFFIRSQPNIFTYIQGYAHADLLTRVHMHRKDTNVFMLSMISVAQQTYDHLANICHSTLQAVKYTWIYASTHLFLASNARMSPALIYTTHATQLLHSASSFHWRHKQKKGFNILLIHFDTILPQTEEKGFDTFFAFICNLNRQKDTCTLHIQ